MDGFVNRPWDDCGVVTREPPDDAVSHWIASILNTRRAEKSLIISDFVRDRLRCTLPNVGWLVNLMDAVEGKFVSLQEGWYPDPNDASRMKFWTGNGWQGERTWNGSAWVDSLTGVSAAAPPSDPVSSTATLNPSPGLQPATGPAPQPASISVDFAAIQSQLNTLGRMSTWSATSWLILGGSLATALSAFFPWVDQTTNLDGLGSYTESSGLTSGGKFVYLALGVVFVVLSWPVLTRKVMSLKRTIGLTVVVGLSILLMIAGYSQINKNGPGSTAGLGLLVGSAGLVAVTIGLIRVWTKRRGGKAIDS